MAHSTHMTDVSMSCLIWPFKSRDRLKKSCSLEDKDVPARDRERGAGEAGVESHILIARQNPTGTLSPKPTVPIILRSRASNSESLATHVDTKDLPREQPADMRTFPAELEDLIIDHLRGNKKALASCGLASRHCTFIPSIRILSISRYKKDRSLGMDFTELIPELACLPSLTCLRVYARWTDLSADSVTKFIAVFHDIREIVIDSPTIEAQHLVALLARLPRLEKVVVNTLFMTLATGMQTLPKPPDPPRSLQSVRLCLEYPDSPMFILNWIVKDPPNVRTLGLSRIWPEELPVVGTHLRTLGPTLRELDLELVTPTSSRVVTESLAPHFACLAHVAHLTVRVDLYGFEPKHWGAYWTLLEALPRAPAALETLTIGLSGTFEYLQHLDWAHLYAAVRVHTRLRLLRFLVPRHIFGESVVEEIRNRVEPDFAARGSVEVEAD
ncbi:hypothetical protein GGX14DRAFT_394407 [Mycena pura]|uniref:Uncharacterized protein n=1 Tax=Mycena pura TaxID=153505 RepID=A0AAD6VFU5_9AGAR|nr:hypothetical protein GGX14DRAFT_394407 [Mycena pura]